MVHPGWCGVGVVTGPLDIFDGPPRLVLMWCVVTGMSNEPRYRPQTVEVFSPSETHGWSPCEDLPVELSSPALGLNGWRDEPQTHQIPEWNIRGGPRMRECIGTILTTGNFRNKNLSAGHLFLQPELLDVEVSYVPNPLPHENASGGGGICF